MNPNMLLLKSIKPQQTTAQEEESVKGFAKSQQAVNKRATVGPSQPLWMRKLHLKAK